ARCFGMNMPKSRDIQAKIPLPQAIWNERHRKTQIVFYVAPCYDGIAVNHRNDLSRGRFLK
ncbi:hypothetical protein, partial [Blautia wexlerae]|uniref:hypothetical protein n=1 Tax=Blautia wexlerae TaxID=418240 RepID=UPI001A9A35DC